MLRQNQTHIVKPGIILLGFIALATQIIMLREFLTLFNGNELVIGIIFANWMLLTGFGSYLGKFSKKGPNIKWVLGFLGILAFLPTLTVLVLHFAWYYFFPIGMAAGINHVSYYSLIILAPFCIISGMLFTQFANMVSVLANKNKIGDVYAWESIGSLIAGIVVNFVLIWFSTTFQSLFLLMIVSVIVTFFLGIKNDSYILSSIVVIASFLFGYYFMNVDLDKKVREMAFFSQEVLYTSSSPYGIFAIAKQGEQINYYENNLLMASTSDVITKEESVHFAMVQHKNPKQILVFSGIVSGIVEEILEYPVQNIDYVDINPEVFKIAEKTIHVEAYKRLNLIEKGPVRYLKGNSKKYDVVLINLPEPSTIQLNRYYTQEFFKLLKENLNEAAIVSLSLPSSTNYLNEELRKQLSIIYKTLKTQFANVLILPASSDFLLASDNNLKVNIAESIDGLNIPTEYVNSYYFDDELLEYRSSYLHNQIDHSVQINKDFSPVFYQSQLQLWMSKYNMKYWIPALVIILFSGFFYIKADYINKGVFAAGFVGSSIEIILVLVFQVVFGFVYVTIGMFVMVFMGGLAFGAYYISRYYKEVDKKVLLNLQVIISIFAFMVPVVFLLIKNFNMHDTVLFSIFILLVFIISALTGAVFTVASKISNKSYGSIAAGVYGLDLLGAATGALLFTIYIIPLFGFFWSLLVAGFFNLFVFLLNHLRLKY